MAPFDWPEDLSHSKNHTGGQAGLPFNNSSSRPARLDEFATGWIQHEALLRPLYGVDVQPFGERKIFAKVGFIEKLKVSPCWQ